VAFGAPPADVLTKLNLKAGEAVVVNRIIPGLTGDKAGLKVGDVVTGFDGKPVDPATIVDTIRAMPVGQKIEVTVLRDGKSETLASSLIEKPRDPGTDTYEVIYSEVLSNGKRMRTIISKPKSAGKHPALLFIQGIGPTSYDFNLNGQGLDAPVLFDFANRGFVTLRVDKPGIGDSEGGPYAQTDYLTELDIYRQALKQLKGLDYVDPDNVFIFGHSMGGAFGPMVGAEIPVKGMAMYGIATRGWEEYFVDNIRHQSLLSGASFADTDDAVRQSTRAMNEVFQEGKTPEQVISEHPDWQATVEGTFQNGLFSGRVTSFWKQLEDINFSSYWAKCNTHVLAAWGESDFISFRADHQLAVDVVNSVHPGWGKFATIPNSDHIFAKWPSELESMRHFPAGDFNPAFLNVLRDWVADVMKGGSK
jgi:hypothetical protein